jgi:CheY-like chemotaxis protein
MKILIAEDEPDIWKPYKIALEARNHDVVITEDGEQSLNTYRRQLLNQKKKATNEFSRNATITRKTKTKAKKKKTKLQQPFDVVVLDYRMPKKNGLEVAKQILKLNPKQRIIFASAYVRETLEDSVKQLKKVVELMQKPFKADALVDTIEDKEIYEGVKRLMANVKQIEDPTNPTSKQIMDLFKVVKQVHKGITF